MSFRMVTTWFLLSQVWAWFMVLHRPVRHPELWPAFTFLAVAFSGLIAASWLCEFLRGICPRMRVRRPRLPQYVRGVAD